MRIVGRKVFIGAHVISPEAELLRGISRTLRSRALRYRRRSEYRALVKLAAYLWRSSSKED